MIVTPIFKEMRLRSKEHMARVGAKPCCHCGARPVQVHHVKPLQLRARGLKSGDDKTVPLCLPCHIEVEVGDERIVWARWGIDPAAISDALTAESIAVGIVFTEHKPRAKPTRQIPAKKFTVPAKPWHGGKRKINNRGWKP